MRATGGDKRNRKQNKNKRLFPVHAIATCNNNILSRGVRNDDYDDGDEDRLSMNNRISRTLVRTCIIYNISCAKSKIDFDRNAYYNNTIRRDGTG